MKAIGYVRVAIGYVRVSTDRQAEQGVSLEAQEAKIRAMATVQGAELFEVIVDGGESAKNLNRLTVPNLRPRQPFQSVRAVWQGFPCSRRRSEAS